jgi:4-hydroxymandelate oxidase
MEKTRRDLLKTITALAGGAIIPFAGQSKPGISGIIVSNHSGRNLDTVPATIEALPRIAEKINKRVPVLMDGGIRRGTDVLKAIALGANAVLVGKPICFGLACGGAEGVTKVLDILRKEFELAMALTGRATVADIDASVIWK